MTASLVQTATGSGQSVSSVTVTLGSNTGTGNCLIVYVGVNNSGTSPTVSGITLGGLADNFALAKRATTANDGNAEIWTDQNAASGKTSVVVSLSGSTSVTVRVEEWSGLVTTSAVDKTNGQSVGTTTSWSSLATGTLTQSSELVVGMVAAATIGSSITITGPTSPWTNTTKVADPFNLVQMITGHQVVSATTSVTYNGTFSSSEPYAAAIVSLKIFSGVNVNLPLITRTTAAFAVNPPLYFNLPLVSETRAAYTLTPQILPLKSLIYSITNNPLNTQDQYGNTELPGASVYSRGTPTFGLQATSAGLEKWIASGPTANFSPAVTPSIFSTYTGRDTTVNLKADTASFKNISIVWTIAAQDSSQNTLYELEVFGWGNQSTSTAFGVTFQFSAGGQTISDSLPTSFCASNDAFAFRVRGIAIVNAAQNNTIYLGMDGSVESNIGGVRTPITGFNNNSVSWNPLISNTVFMQAEWTGSDGTNELFGSTSKFTRGGA